MQHVRQFDVVDEQRLPVQEPIVLVAFDRGAEIPRAHGAAFRNASAAAIIGVDDVLVAGAAADVAGQRLANVVLGRRRMLFQIRRHRHQDARRAIAALQTVMLVHRLLNRIELAAVAREALDGREFVAVGLHRQHQAGADRDTIEQNGAGAADAMLAADMGAGQPQFVAQEIAQQHPRVGGTAVGSCR